MSTSAHPVIDLSSDSPPPPPTSSRLSPLFSPGSSAPPSQQPSLSLPLASTSRPPSLLPHRRPPNSSHILAPGAPANQSFTQLLRDRALHHQPQGQGHFGQSSRELNPRADVYVPRDARGDAGRPIDLAESSESEDEGGDVVFTGENRAAAPPPRPRGLDDVQRGELDRARQDIDRILARRSNSIDALLAADAQDPRRRAVLSPPLANPAPAPPRRIGLGGAVLRRGDRQVNYVPPPNPAERMRVINDRHVPRRRAVDPDAEYQPDPEDGEEALEMGIQGIYAGLLADIGMGLGGAGGRAARGGGGGAGGGGGYMDRLRTQLGLYRGGFGGMRGLGMGMDIAGALAELRGVGGAGARDEDDVSAMIAKVQLPTWPAPRQGFTRSFEIKDEEPIVLDDDGKVISHPANNKKRKRPPFLQCSGCAEPLRISAAYRSPADRVWALRCGHLVDQRCLTRLSQPSTPDEVRRVVNMPPEGLAVLGGGEEPARGQGRRGGPRRGRAVRKVPPAEYSFACPVEGCGGRCAAVRERVQVQVEGEGKESVEKWEWKQKDGRGAVVVYA